MKRIKILVLCTGNSCRSQMAEGFLKSFNPELIVHSAGTNPGEEVHPLAIKVMDELGVNIKNNKPKSVNDFLDNQYDYVITVCGGARDNCPVFKGNVKKQVHIGFDDPAEAVGTEDEIISEFRRIRDEILIEFFSFYNFEIIQ